jgi:hypothetical protein
MRLPGLCRLAGPNEVLVSADIRPRISRFTTSFDAWADRQRMGQAEKLP